MKKNIQTLEDALYDLTHHSDVPAKAQAEALGVSYQRLVNSCVGSSSETAHHPTRFIVPQTLLTRNYVLLDYIERQVGRVAFTLPEVQMNDTAENCRVRIMRITRELGDVAGTAEKGFADDGRLSLKEKAACEKEAYDLVVEAVKYLQMMKKR